MDLSYYLLGYYTISVKEKDYKRLLNICTYHGITFWNLCISKECTFSVRADQLKQIKAAAQKTDISYEVLKISGLPVLIQRVKQHIWFLVGAVMALFLLISLSLRVWEIEVIGNSYYGPDIFARFLDSEGIKTGMPVNKIQYAKLASDIRESFERVTWASCEIDGCRLNIYIKENQLLKDEKEHTVTSGRAYDLIAEKEGTICSLFVRNGVARIEEGQSVAKGEVLISGLVPILNDAAEVISYQPVISDADVAVFCEYSYYHEIERQWFEYKEIETRTIPYLQIDKYRFDIRDPKIQNDIFFDVLHITQNRFSHIEYGTIRLIKYEKIPRNYSDDELKQMAESHFEEFCSNLLKKGVQIYENNVKMNVSDVSCITSGNIVVIEKIGTLKEVQIPMIDHDITEE